MEIRNVRLEERLDAVRRAVLDLALTVDENLRTVLLLMTTEASVTPGLQLKDTRLLQDAVMDRCMQLFGLQAPVARDLRWAMGMIRVGKDYERVQELARALMKRVEELSGTLLEEVLHAMTEVMRRILALHALLLACWRQPAESSPPSIAATEAAWDAVEKALEHVEDLAAQAMLRGEGSPEHLRELVLANRHLRRIADQIANVPEELAQIPPTPPRAQS